MTTSQTILQSIPIFSASKSPAPVPETKSANTTFNQVLKNEVNNKAKKNPVEQVKAPSANNNKTNSVSTDATKPVEAHDTEEVRTSGAEEDVEQEQQTNVDLSDPSALLAFVNTLSNLANDDQSSNDESSDTNIVQTLEGNQSSSLITESEDQSISTVQNPSTLAADLSDRTLPSNADVPLNDFVPNQQNLQRQYPKLTDDHVPTAILGTRENDPSQINIEKTLPFTTKDQHDQYAVEPSTNNVVSEAVKVATMQTRLTANETPSSEILVRPPAEASVLNQLGMQSAIQQAGPIAGSIGNMSKAESNIVFNKDLSKLSSPAENLIAQSENPKGNDLSIDSMGNAKELSTLQSIVDKDNFSKELESKLTQERQADFANAKSIASKESSTTPDKFASINNAAAITAPLEIINATPISDHIGPRVGSRGWDQAIGQKIVWMVAGGEQSAQLTLNPPDLGPVQVVLSISDNFVDASFVSSHLDVREAIEAAAPKLREMMDSAGISLSGFSVSADAAQSGNAFSDAQTPRNMNNHGREVRTNNDTEIANTTLPSTVRSSRQDQGLVDTFA